MHFMSSLLCLRCNHLGLLPHTRHILSESQPTCSAVTQITHVKVMTGASWHAWRVPYSPNSFTSQPCSAAPPCSPPIITQPFFEGWRSGWGQTADTVHSLMAGLKRPIQAEKSPDYIHIPATHREVVQVVSPSHSERVSFFNRISSRVVH